MIRSVIFTAVLMLVILPVFGQRKNKEVEPVSEYRESYNDFRLHYEEVEVVIPVKSKDEKPLEPKNDISKFLKEKLDSVYFYNANICCADGFRVLIYVGASSVEASTAKNNAYDILPFEKSYKLWHQPSFKVKVGDFVDKLEAFYAYANLVKIFPNAIVVPDKVNIVREQ